MTIGAWFGTAYDEPSAALDLPVEVTSGTSAGVRIVDQVMRGTGIVGRATASYGAVALSVRADGRPVRVTVTIQLDELSTRWWADRVKPARGQAERPRLALIRAQGELRAAAVLARRQGWRRAAAATATVEFDLAADDLAGDGLLVVELAEPAGALPGWAADRLAASSAVGLRIDRIEVRERVAGAGAPACAPVAGPDGAALVVLRPGSPGRFRLALAATPPAPPLPRSPTNRWTRQKPARAAFKALRIGRRVAGWLAAATTPASRPARRTGGLTARAVDLHTSAAVAVDVVGRAPGRLDLRLAAAPAGLVLVGLVDGTPSRERTARQLSCRIAPATPAASGDGAR